MVVKSIAARTVVLVGSVALVGALLIAAMKIESIRIYLDRLFSSIAVHEVKPFLNGNSNTLDGYDSAATPGDSLPRKRGP